MSLVMENRETLGIFMFEIEWEILQLLLAASRRTKRTTFSSYSLLCVVRPSPDLNMHYTQHIRVCLFFFLFSVGLLTPKQLVITDLI